MKQPLRKISKNRFLWAIVFFLLIVSLVAILTSEKKKSDSLITYVVQRQDLVISVLEGGNLQALRSQKIVNEVPGQRSILEVIDEGTQITDEDVTNGKILVKLDSKDLEDRSEQLGINLETSLAALLDAQQNLEIQKKQNESDIKQVELEGKFARMDLEKYLGKELAAELIGGANIDFPALMKSPALEGEAKNRKRELENRIDIANEEVARAEDKVEWSEKLEAKGYVTKSELEADKLSLKQKKFSIEKAELDDQLFLNYDFPKQVEKLVSDHQESLNELERTKAKCESRIVKGEANVKGKEATHLRYKNDLEEKKEQITNCTIRATQPGFVVYATSNRPWRSQDPIQPGTTVRQRQELLNLPDFSTMGVQVKIHESSVEKVKRGQKAIVKVDTFPEETFTGEVVKVALMPDPTLKWMNPDINVYVTQIALDKGHELLKPGMSAQVEIIARKLEDVLVIPVMAIAFNEGEPICTVLKGRMIENIKVKLGESNEEMVEVRAGLREGDMVAISSGKMTYQVKTKPRAERGSFREGEATQPPPASESRRRPRAEGGRLEGARGRESTSRMGRGERGASGEARTGRGQGGTPRQGSRPRQADNMNRRGSQSQNDQGNK